MDDFIEIMVFRHNRANVYVSSWKLWQQVEELHRLKTDEIPAERKEGGHKIPPLADKILAFDCLQKRDSQFSSVENTCYIPRSRACPTPSSWPTKIGLHGWGGKWKEKRRKHKVGWVGRLRRSGRSYGRGIIIWSKYRVWNSQRTDRNILKKKRKQDNNGSPEHPSDELPPKNILYWAPVSKYISTHIFVHYYCSIRSPYEMIMYFIHRFY